MPRITYTPGDKPHVLEFEWDDLDSTYVMRVEKMTGRNYGDLADLLYNGNIGVLHALLFVVAKKAGVLPANTSPESFVFKPSEVEVDFSTAEAQMTYDGMVADESRSEAETAAMAVLAERPDVNTTPTPDPESDPEGKD